MKKIKKPKTNPSTCPVCLKGNKLYYVPEQDGYKQHYLCENCDSMWYIQSDGSTYEGGKCIED